MSAPRREDQPDGSVRVVFAQPILEHGEPKGSVTFRPPTVGEVLDLGDPATWVIGESGQAVSIVERPLLRQWAGRLAKGCDIDLIAREPDPALGLLIEEVILGFFQSARRRLKPASAPSSPAA
jgi:hypothetical protein